MKRMMQKRLTALVLALAVTATQASWLVTDEEAQLSRSAPTMPEAKSVPVPGSPRIVLLQPDLASTVTSPTRIQLRFESAGDAAIRPDTFKVRYGTLRLDITQRLLAISPITPQGIDVSEAKLPKGSHRLFMEIQDSAGRTGERAASFVVN